ncbi:MAG: hypothetical protein J6330_00325 [Clostridia bacterium]|nr:hypothetical protein [Clostridia bacterium]
MKNAPVAVNERRTALSEKKRVREEANRTDITTLPKTKIISSVFTNDAETHKSVPFGILFIICIFTFAAIFITFLSVRVNEVNNEISALNSQLADIREQTAEAKADIFEKKDITEIRKTAEELGMVRSEYLPAHYITVNAEDKITVYAEEEEQRQFGFAALLSAVGDGVSSFIEYMK